MKTAAISKPLTAKQSRFIDEYMVDMNGAAAAVRCGYSKRTSRAIACELLTKPDILAGLQARQTADAARLSIQREDVLNGLVEAAAMAKLQCDPAGMVAAWKQVGHLMGYYSPERIKVDMRVQGQTMANHLERLSDAELLALIASGGGGATAAN
jgi:phage terminase small subunit